MRHDTEPSPINELIRDLRAREDERSRTAADVLERQAHAIHLAIEDLRELRQNLLDTIGSDYARVVDGLLTELLQHQTNAVQSAQRT